MLSKRSQSAKKSLEASNKVDESIEKISRYAEEIIVQLEKYESSTEVSLVFFLILFKSIEEGKILFSSSEEKLVFLSESLLSMTKIILSMPKSQERSTLLSHIKKLIKKNKLDSEISKNLVKNLDYPR
jgi:hypothetical protein